jgi:hypothetical protein
MSNITNNQENNTENKNNRIEHFRKNRRRNNGIPQIHPDKK